MRNWLQQIRPFVFMMSTILTLAVATWTHIHDVNERKAGCIKCSQWTIRLVHELREVVIYITTIIAGHTLISQL